MTRPTLGTGRGRREMAPHLRRRQVKLPALVLSRLSLQRCAQQKRRPAVGVALAEPCALVPTSPSLARTWMSLALPNREAFCKAAQPQRNAKSHRAICVVPKPTLVHAKGEICGKEKKIIELLRVHCFLVSGSVYVGWGYYYYY